MWIRLSHVITIVGNMIGVIGPCVAKVFFLPTSWVPECVLGKNVSVPCVSGHVCHVPCVSVSACPFVMGSSVICPCGETCTCCMISPGVAIVFSTIRKTCAHAASCLQFL